MAESSRPPAPDQAWFEWAANAGRVAVLSTAIPVMAVVTTGWLYLLRGSVAGWPGPRVQDALPLDELPGKAAVPLVAFVVVFAAGAGVLGLLARAFRFERISSTLALGLGTAASLLVADVVSLYVVRQVPLGTAFYEAFRLQPVYLAAVIAGAAGGLLGVPARAGVRWNRLLAWLVALGGLTDLLSAIMRAGRSFFHAFGPGASLLAAPLMVPIGVLLLATARGLSRGRRPAYLLGLSLLGASTALRLLHGRHYAWAIVSGVLGLLLYARRQDFTSPAALRSRRRAFTRLASMLGAALVFGMASLVVVRMVAGLPFDLPAALVDTCRAFLGWSPRSSQYLPAGFSLWFRWSVMSVGALGVVWAADAWLAPWRSFISDDERRRRIVTRLVRCYGVDTLAPFALRRDKAMFLYSSSAGDEDQAVIAYRVVRGLALVSGDPIGPPGLLPGALDAFVEAAHHRGWKVAVLGASDRCLELYRERGMHELYHGDEAVIEVTSFSLEGGRRRAVRQAVSRLHRHGYTSEVLCAGDVPESLRDELAHVERVWLNGKDRRGFSMQLDDLFRLGGEDAIFTIGRSSDGRLAGFLHLALCPAGRAVSLSSMPRLSDLPNGFTSWLIVETVRWAAENGYDHVSLNFSPFANLLQHTERPTLAGRVEREVLLRAKAALSLQLDNLQRFNQQFGPQPRRRYVVYERRADLPLIALAAMAAEGYLPFSERLRGREWRSHAPEAVLPPGKQTAPLVPSRRADDGAEEVVG